MAVKVFHAAAPVLPDATPVIDDSFAQEVRVLSALRHPRVVRLLGACVRPPLLAIVQQLAVGGSLWALLRRVGPLPHVQLLDIAIDVAEAMDYLAAMRIIHRDLKPHNVLLDSKGRAMVLVVVVKWCIRMTYKNRCVILALRGCVSARRRCPRPRGAPPGPQHTWPPRCLRRGASQAPQ